MAAVTGAPALQRVEPWTEALATAGSVPNFRRGETTMIRRLSSGKYRLYSKKKDSRTGKRKNLGTFGSRAAAEKHERAVQYFKRP